MKILLCVNGAPTTRPAMAYGVWLAALMQSEVTLLGVVEEPASQPSVEDLLDEASRQLEDRSIPYQRLTLEGLCREVIAELAAKDEYLTVVGPLGRPLWRRWIRGRSIRRLLVTLESPLVYVPAFRSDLRRMLLCLGGIGRSAAMVQLAKQLALASHAEVTLLHIVEPTTFEYPLARAAHDRWETLLATDTPQARHLQAALDKLKAAGLATTMRIRQGSAIQEIIREMREEDYDLVGVGSHYSAEGLRPLFMPNVTSAVAEAAERPVLVAR